MHFLNTSEHFANMQFSFSDKNMLIISKWSNPAADHRHDDVVCPLATVSYDAFLSCLCWNASGFGRIVSGKQKWGQNRPANILFLGEMHPFLMHVQLLS